MNAKSNLVRFDSWWHAYLVGGTLVEDSQALSRHVESGRTEVLSGVLTVKHPSDDH
jgi:hypothetical protein